MNIRKVRDEEDTYDKFTSYKVSEDYGIDVATDEKSLLEGIDSILKQTTSRDTAAYKAAKYLEETPPEIAKQWMQKKGIVSYADFKKWCANRQSKVRRGVREERKEYDRQWAQMKAGNDVNNIMRQALEASRKYDEYLNSVHDSKNQNTMRSTKFKSKKIQDAVTRFLNKDLKNRQSFMRVVDSEGKIKESVIFRVEDDGNILSVFPNTYGNADRSRDTMVCADSKGHSVCTYDYVEEYTRAADSAEYEALYNQLTDSVGYNLTVLDKLPTRTELAKVRDNFIKAYNIERRRKLADSLQQIADERTLERGDKIEYNGNQGIIQYALFHGKGNVVICWKKDGDGKFEEFEVPFDETLKMKVNDSKADKPKAENKVKDESAEENVDENVDENTDIEEGDEVADNCGKKKKTKDSKVNIFKRKTTKKA